MATGDPALARSLIDDVLGSCTLMTFDKCAGAWGMTLTDNGENPKAEYQVNNLVMMSTSLYNGLWDPDLEEHDKNVLRFLFARTASSDRPWPSTTCKITQDYVANIGALWKHRWYTSSW